MNIVDDSGSCGPYDANFSRTADRINRSTVPYHPFTTNSNATVTEILRGGGFSPGPPARHRTGLGHPSSSEVMR
jgi:hypothetical protein